MKTTNKRKQKLADSCKAEILKKSGIMTDPNGQAYLRPEYHDRISEIIALFGDNDMTVEDYLDNVLAEHFTQFKNAIDASLNQDDSHRRRKLHDVRRVKCPTTGRPVKRDTREVSPADAERSLAIFMEASEIKTRQCIYITREIHEKVAIVANRLGKGLSIGKFVDNVLRDHFRQYGAQYTEQIENSKKVRL